MAVLARAEDGAADIGLDACCGVALADGDIGDVDVSSIRVVGTCHTAAGTEDTAVVAARGAETSATDIDGGEAAALQHGSGAGEVVFTYRGDGAAAVDVVVDEATGDQDVGVAVDTTCREAEVCLAAAGGVGVNTAATAVDVAEEDDDAGRHTAVVVGDGVWCVDITLIL